MLSSHPLSIELASIVAKASSFAERLNTTVVSNAAYRDDPTIAARLQRWCHVVAKGNSAKFHRRLAWDGLDIDTVHPLLADAQNNEQQPLPRWATTLGQAIQAAQTLPKLELFSSHRYLDPENPIPFEPVYVPFLQLAQHQLSARVGSRLDVLTDAAQIALERSLLQRLATIGSWVLMQEFSKFRSSGSALLDFLQLRLQSRESREKYEAFIQKLFQDGLLSFVQDYSVLGRLLATEIDFWVDSTAEFLNRLVADWFDIEQSFSGNIRLKQVVALELDLSDPHNQGRRVIALTFDTGLKLVYKPKSLRLEATFCQLLDWCNNRAGLLTFKVLQVLDRSTHGWVEFIKSSPCDDEAAARRFYQRSGMLLCLIHTLQGTDCHSENLIASGEQPVLLDMETLLHHWDLILEPTKFDAQTLAERQLMQSVLRTWILPQWGTMPNDQISLDVSGLGGAEEQGVTVLKLQNINTDAMAPDYATITLKQDNAATLNGIPLSPADYLEDLVAGFEQMYCFLLSHQDALLASDGPLMALADENIRYVFRPTRIYSTILQNSYEPSLLRSGIDRSISLDALSRVFLIPEEKPFFWSILAAEIQAMEQLDIPYFAASSSSDCLPLPTGAVIPKFFKEASFERVVLQVQRLNETDLAQQIEIIRGAFYSRFVREPSPLQLGETFRQNISTAAEDTLPFPFGDPSHNAIAPLSSDPLVQQAIAIAQSLQQRAICAVDGSVSWMGLGYRANSQTFQLQGLGYSLYDGSPGVALFFAALSKITSDSQWHDLALRTLQPLRQLLQDSNPHAMAQLTRRLGISGATGLSSIGYALVKSTQLLQEPALLQDAKKAVSLITPELIATDQTFNIMGGAAGAILGLLAVQDAETVHPSVASAPLALAIASGEHLLKHQTSLDNCPQAWKTWNGKQLTGFSQGAAGIAHALLRLFAVTQDSRFLNAVVEAIAYEQSVFSTDAQNWPDFRFETPHFQVSWAHGAPGIGLGRLGGLSVLDTPEICQEIAIALETTQKFGVWGVDHLCWGNLGRMETLLVASETLNRPDLLAMARKAAALIVTQACDRGAFTLFSDLPAKVYNPGFFHGTTGIGYQLLRLAYPGLLPSVLLWE